MEPRLLFPGLCYKRMPKIAPAQVVPTIKNPHHGQFSNDLRTDLTEETNTNEFPKVKAHDGDQEKSIENINKWKLRVITEDLRKGNL